MTLKLILPGCYDDSQFSPFQNPVSTTVTSTKYDFVPVLGLSCSKWHFYALLLTNRTRYTSATCSWPLTADHYSGGGATLINASLSSFPHLPIYFLLSPPTLSLPHLPTSSFIFPSFPSPSPPLRSVPLPLSCPPPPISSTSSSLPSSFISLCPHFLFISWLHLFLFHLLPHLLILLQCLQ